MAKLTGIQRTRFKNQIKDALIPTWQSLAAISFISGLPVKTCETILVEMYNDGEVKCRRAILDGHNRTYIFKKPNYMVILGVKTEIEQIQNEA